MSGTVWLPTKPDTTENVSNQLSKQAENMPNQQGKESKRLPNTLKAMLALISRNPQVTYEQLAKELNISRKLHAISTDGKLNTTSVV